MTSAQVIEEVRAKIDEWVLTKPPPPIFPRRYTLSENLEGLSDAIIKLLGPIVDSMKHLNFRTFDLAFPSEAQTRRASFSTKPEQTSSGAGQSALRFG